MTDQWKREAKEMYLAAKNARVPENLSVLAEDVIAKSREAFDQFQSVSKDSTRSLETVLQTAQDGARTIGERVLRNIERTRNSRLTPPRRWHGRRRFPKS